MSRAVAHPARREGRVKPKLDENLPAIATLLLLPLVACGALAASPSALTIAPVASASSSEPIAATPAPSASTRPRTHRFRMPSGSMIPTLHVGQLFATDVLAPSDVLRRGDVIVFLFPEHPEQRFVKRIAALDGDRFEMLDARPHINGWPVPRCLVGRYGYDDAEDPSVHHEGDLFVEFLDAATYFVFIEAGLAMDFGQGPWTVSAGETWVLGDNRNSSHDSRMWYGGRGGGVPRAMVKERMRVPETLTLPSDADPALKAKLDACLANRPKSTPPGRSK